MPVNPTWNRASITAETALELIRRACEEARLQGLSIAVSIVDESGIEKAFLRMDGAPLIAVQTALKKARMAVGFGMPTGDAWHRFMKSDDQLNDGARDLPGFILLGGGTPLMHNGQIAGAIGISGGHYSQDERCAEAAMHYWNGTTKSA